MQAWDVTLFIRGYTSSLDADENLERALADWPLAHYTEIGGAQSYRDNGWDMGDRIWIDTVFFDKSCTKDYVLASLKGHDGYPNNTEIFKA